MYKLYLFSFKLENNDIKNDRAYKLNSIIKNVILLYLSWKFLLFIF